MLPGMNSRVGVSGGGLTITTQFLKALNDDQATSGTVKVPDGYTSARMTCFAAGNNSTQYTEYYDSNGDGYNDSSYTNYETGAGGMMVQSVMAVTPGENLSYQVLGRRTYNWSPQTSLVQRGSTVLLQAFTSAGVNAPTSNYVGQKFFKGGNGIYDYAAGAGAAGTLGEGGNANYGPGGSPGASVIFKQTSHGETAGPGRGGYQAPAANYGGGAGSGGQFSGASIIIIEWGFGQPGVVAPQ